MIPVKCPNCGKIYLGFECPFCDGINELPDIFKDIFKGGFA